jgi:deoxyguanosine kinase
MTDLARFRHVAIEGPIGAGKTTLAGLLAPHLGAELLLEQPDENPFLAKFYAEGARHALPTQLAFLFQRIDQYRMLAQPGMFAPRVVSDFMFDKDALFARLTLSNDEYALYCRVHAQAAPQQPEPDLVIWLRAEPALLAERIARRGRAMERDIDARYLQRIADAYAEHFDDHPSLPVLAVDVAGFDPLGRPADLPRLLEAMRAFAGPRGALDAPPTMAA